MKPWEKYQTADKEESGPWDKYAKAEPEPKKKSSPIPIPLELMAAHTQGETGYTPPAPWKRTLSDFARPLLEGGGAAGGSILGAGAGTVAGIPTGPGATLTGLAGGVAGGTLGYGMGKQGADLLDQFLELRGPKDLKELTLGSAKDLQSGLEYELVGQGAGALIKPVFQGGKWLFRKAGEALAGATAGAGAGYAIEGEEGAKTGALLGAGAGLGIKGTRSIQMQKAGKILLAHTSAGTIYAQNAKQAAELEKQIPGLKFTLGQRTGDPNLIKLERAQMRKPGTAASLNSEQIATNNEALRNYYQKNFPGKEGIDDISTKLQSIQTGLKEDVAGTREAAIRTAVEPGPVGPQITGTKLVDEIGTVKQPIKEAIGDLESQIPDYPMQFSNTDKAIADVLGSKKISINQRKAVERIQGDIEKVLEQGKSTHTAFGVRRTINDAIDAASGAGKDSEAAALMQVKNGLEADLSEVSKMARTGKIAEYKGGTVRPDELAAELERNAQKIATTKAVQEPDIDLMVKELRERNGPPTDRVVREGERDYINRISRDYTRITGKETPFKSVSKDTEYLGQLSERNEQIKGILRDVEPGQDVASAMKAYNDFASKEYFGRFQKGAVKQATARGTQATGTAARAENIPNYFTTSTGADDLIRAIGPEKAGGIMRGHYAYDLLQNTTGPDGYIITSKLSNWMKRNLQTLKTFGIDTEFDSIAKAQSIVEDALTAAREFEKSAAARFLKADPEKAIGEAIKGSTTGKAAADLLKRVGGDQAATNGLKNAFAEHIMTQIQTTAKDVAGNPTISNAAFQRTMEKYAPAMKVLYRDEPGKYEALKTMRNAFEIATRNTRSPIGGGSDTAENILSSLVNINILNRPATILRGLWNTISKYSKNQVDDLVTRAMFDPDYADTLVKMARGKISEQEFQTIIKGKIIKLDDYRQARQAAAAAGLGAAYFGEE